MRRGFCGTALAVVLIWSGVLAYSLLKQEQLTPQAYFERGKQYYDEKNYSEAAIQFSNAIRIDVHHRDARYFLALTYEKQEFRGAVVTLNSLLEDYPDDVPAWLELGRIYFALGQTNPKFLHEAQEIANKILTIDAQNVKALVLSGNVSTALKDYASATDLYEKAAKIDPTAPEAVAALSRSKTVQKN